MSGVSIDFGAENRAFYVWGGKSMIETISQSALVQGSQCMGGFGAYGRGGSQNAEGITMIDYLTEGS